MQQYTLLSTASFIVAETISVEVMGSAQMWQILNTEVVFVLMVVLSVSAGSGRRDKPSALACYLNLISY